MEFEWSEEKARKNLIKHKISFSEASSVFGDRVAITFDEPDHSVVEHRLVTFGYSRMNRLLAVIHCERDEKIRIIS